jgi:hypothetical protein
MWVDMLNESIDRNLGGCSDTSSEYSDELDDIKLLTVAIDPDPP